MTVAAPSLVPLFRSELQFRVLGFLASSSDREASVSELAEVADSSYAATWAEVDRLLTLGTLKARRVGRSKLVSLSDEPTYSRALRQLLLHTYGPLPHLLEELQPLQQVADAFVYGSWARRYAGDDGPQPRDVDVLVLIEPGTDPVEVYQACARVTDATGETINPTVLTVEEWERDDSAFASNLRDQPRIGILGDSYGKVRS